MPAFTRLAQRLWYLLNRRRLEQELEREMASHRAMLDDPGRFGNAIRLREQNADVWGWTWADDLVHDLRYAARLLVRAPGFAAAAITTIALGIGTSIAIFSVVYGVSLRPLPYPDPDRLVRIYEANPASGRLRHDVSVGAFQEWREAVRSIESAALLEENRVAYLEDANEQPVASRSVSPAFFRTLGVAPLLGSGFQAESAYTGRRTDEVVLSYGAWQRLFGGRPDVIGQSLRFWRDDDSWLVVGVMPASFSFGQPVDVWRPEIIPLRMGPALRNLRQDDVIARLRPGVTLDQARAELEAVTARLARDFPATNAGWGVTVEPLRDAVIGNFGRATWLLLAAVAVVLLVACINVAGLLLARTVTRTRETAVREALGARPGRLLRLWLTEASLLAALGTSLGVLLAWSGVNVLKAAAPPGIPRLDAIAIDLPVLGVAAGFMILAMAIITAAPLGPAMSPARGDHRRQLVTRLQASSAAAGNPKERQAARKGLLLAQCAGAAALVVLSVMLTRSFIKLMSFDLGWNATGVLSLNVAPATRFTTGYGIVDWSDRLIAQLAARSGIERAAITSQVPLSALSYSDNFAAGRGSAAGDDRRWSGVIHSVTDAYFQVMGVRLLDGRTFGPADRFAPSHFNRSVKNERGVVVISQTVARTLWPGQPAIGQALWIPTVDGVVWREVIGIVEDIQFHAIGEVPALHLFVPWTQNPTFVPKLMVKGTGDGGAIVETVREVVQSIDPGSRIDRVAPLDSLVSRATAQARFTTRTVAAFGLLALVLAAIGIYGTLSYVVGARTREIAIRLTLGASRRVILPDVLRRALAPVIAGGVIGVVIAAAIARAFEALLFQVEPLDAASFAAGALLLFLAALAAALAPARRAMKVDPAVALRAE